MVWSTLRVGLYIICLAIAFSPLALASEEEQIWLPGRLDQNLAADRELDEEHLRQLSELNLIVVDKTKTPSERLRAIKKLIKEYRHVLMIPPMLAIIRDEDEPKEFMKDHAIYGLSFINDGRVVPLLIDILFHADGEFGFKAWKQLRLITGRSFCYELKGSQELRSRQAGWWRDWWDENQQDADLSWNSVAVTDQGLDCSGGYTDEQ